MALTFHPPQGTIVICDFSTGFQPPELAGLCFSRAALPRPQISPPISMIGVARCLATAGSRNALAGL
jgi:hypothetical protein